MIKNGFIACSAISLAFIASLHLYTNSQINQKISEQITKLQHQQVVVTMVETHADLFGGRNQYKVALPTDVIEMISGGEFSDEERTLYINHSYDTYPLWVTSEFNLDLTKGVAKDFMMAFPEQSIEHLLTVNTNLLTQSQTSHFRIDPTRLGGAEQHINIGELNINATTDIEFNHGDIAIDLTNFSIDMGADGIFKLHQLSSHARINHLAGMLYAEQSSILVDSIEYLNQFDRVELSISQLSGSSSTNSAMADVVDGQSHLTINTIQIDSGAMAYNITDTTFNMAINNIDKAGFIALNNVNSHQNSELINGFKLIFERGFNATIDQLATTVNNVNFMSQGDFKLPPLYDLKPDNLQTQLIQHLSHQAEFTYALQLSNNYAEVFPMLSIAIANMAANDEIHTDAEGNLSTIISLKQGKMTANGTPVHL